MGWEQRNGRLYYYRKRREGGRVTSEYLGRGPLAEVIAEADRQESLAREHQRQLEARTREHMQTLDRGLRARADRERRLAYLILENLGYHRHKGQWRRRRMDSKHESKELGQIDVLRACRKAIDESNADDTIIPVEDAFRKHPEMMEGLADLSTDVVRSLLNAYGFKAGDRRLFQDRYNRVLREHGHKNASPSEKLLIERVGTCMLRMLLTEMQYDRNVNADGGCRLPLADYFERRLSAAQRRYLQAIETLARVRKLLGVNVQVNIAADGGKQVVANG